MDDQRRKFCQVTGLTVVGAACLPALATVVPSSGCGNNAQPAGVWTITSFKAKDVVMGDAMLAGLAADGFMSQQIWFCRDAGGMYAMSGYCTHAHCVIEWNPNNDNHFLCPCHNSTFDYNGQNNTPPSPAPLPHFKLTVESDGTLVVDAGTVVDPSTRTPDPTAG